jgi:hypothetical protein
MPRLPRFESHRFIGTRDTMRVYDCDDDEQFAELERSVDSRRLVARGLVQTFAPDSLSEAVNRGFHH